MLQMILSQLQLVMLPNALEGQPHSKVLSVVDAKKVDAILWAAILRCLLAPPAPCALCDLYSKGYYDTQRRSTARAIATPRRIIYSPERARINGVGDSKSKGGAEKWGPLLYAQLAKAGYPSPSLARSHAIKCVAAAAAACFYFSLLIIHTLKCLQTKIPTKQRSNLVLVLS